MLFDVLCAIIPLRSIETSYFQAERKGTHFFLYFITIYINVYSANSLFYGCYGSTTIKAHINTLKDYSQRYTKQ